LKSALEFKGDKRKESSRLSGRSGAKETLLTDRHFHLDLSDPVQDYDLSKLVDGDADEITKLNLPPIDEKRLGMKKGESSDLFQSKRDSGE